MTCWEILGIEPTEDKERIRLAYENQSKFATREEADRLRQAYNEALGPEAGAQSVAPRDASPEPAPEDERRQLSGEEEGVVHDVIIQINALLNDSSRSNDVMIWKAILGDPPADQLPLRREIGSRLEGKVKPMAENGAFPAPVTHFLAEWFDWYSLKDRPPHLLDDRDDNEPAFQSGDAEADEPAQPQMQNFWPAVIGWIVGLLILASLFGGMGGGG